MVDVQKVEGLIRNLATYVGHLRDIARTEREAFLNDAARVGGAKYYLQISIEACLNLGNRIIAFHHTAGAPQQLAERVRAHASRVTVMPHGLGAKDGLLAGELVTLAHPALGR